MTVAHGVGGHQGTMQIDGRELTPIPGQTLLAAATALGIHLPTLCWHPQLPAGANCRLCVVEVVGQRALVTACSHPVQPGLAVFTDSARVRRARRMVLELLLAAVDLSDAPEVLAYAAYYGAVRDRFPPATTGSAASAPPPADNPFFRRDYDRCVLCRRCIEVCGTGLQFTYAIGIEGRGAQAGIGTGTAGSLAESPCVFCGNCVDVCPTGALVAVTERTARDAGLWPQPVLAWHPHTGFRSPVPAGGKEG